MYDDIFKGTDFGDIKDKKEEAKENDIIKEAEQQGIWHTGQKPDIWAVDDEDELWDANDDSCDEPKQPTGPKPSQGSSGIFDDIF